MNTFKLTLQDADDDDDDGPPPLKEVVDSDDDEDDIPLASLVNPLSSKACVSFVSC